MPARVADCVGYADGPAHETEVSKPGLIDESFDIRDVVVEGVSGFWVVAFSPASETERDSLASLGAVLERS